MRLRLAVTVALVVVAFSCLPDGAGADGGRYRLRGGRSLSVNFKGSDGYSIGIVSFRKSFLELWTEKGGVSTEYITRDTVADNEGVRARLPGLGAISVRFHRRGPVRRLPPFSDCKGPRPVMRRGVVRGTIKFVGERGYTQVEAHEAPAQTEEWGEQHCRFRPHPRKRHPGKWVGRFSAWGVEGEQAGFTATKFRPGTLKGGQVVFDAAMASSERSLRIYRHARIVAPASTFLVPEPDTYPEHVILSPPAPFAGAGTFARTPESTFTWEGDLSIQFPGIDPVPLTGPHFETHYCALRGCARQDSDESGPPASG
jgi:hypothetical protein